MVNYKIFENLSYMTKMLRLNLVTEIKLSYTGLQCLFFYDKFCESKTINIIGLAPIRHLRTCAIEIVSFKGGHLMW